MRKVGSCNRRTADLERWLLMHDQHPALTLMDVQRMMGIPAERSIRDEIMASPGGRDVLTVDPSWGVRPGGLLSSGDASSRFMDSGPRDSDRHYRRWYLAEWAKSLPRRMGIALDRIARRLLTSWRGQAGRR